MSEAVLTVPDQDAPKLKKLIGAAIKAGHLPASAMAWSSNVDTPTEEPPSKRTKVTKKEKEPKAAKATKVSKSKEKEPEKDPETPWSGLAPDLPAPKSAVTDLGDFDGDDSYTSPFAHIIGKEKPASSLHTWATDPDKMPFPGGPSPKSMPNPTLHPKNVGAADRAKAQSAWDSFAPKGTKPASNLSRSPRPLQNKKPGALARLFGKEAKVQLASRMITTSDLGLEGFDDTGAGPDKEEGY